MLRQIFIYKGNELLYFRRFGKALKQEVLDYHVMEIIQDEESRMEDRIESHDYYKYKISYLTKKDLNLLFLFISGLTDKFENIRRELLRCKKDFVGLFEDILLDKYDTKTFEVFDPFVDSIHKNLRPKISLVGFSGVGKTTITKLIRAEEIPVQHIPTITGDIATIKIGKLFFHLWDFAGQEQFSYLWNNFIKGSDAAILITDSTLENVDKSKFFLELIKEQAPHARTAIIGNKQDLKGALLPAQIEQFLGLKAYSMVAIDPENRDKMIKIIADILDMSAEVSPLLRPLLERDKLIEEATISLKAAEFEKAAFLFDKISYLCIELGDDSLGKEFFEKSKKILEMLKTDIPQQKLDTPVEPKSIEELKTSKAQESSEKVIKAKPKILIETIEVSQESLTDPLPSEAPQLKVQDNETKIKEKIEQVPTTSQWITSSKKSLDQTKTFEDQKEVKKEVLKLNPEDFMVKIRPKSIGVVPKDAKFKLKTSAYGHVKNIASLEQEASINQSQNIESKDMLRAEQVPSKNVSPNFIEQKEVVKPSIPMKSTQDFVDFAQPSSTIDKDQVENIKRNLIELKMRKASLFQKSLDLEMQELEGKISADKLEEKGKEINKYKERIDEKISELENILKDFNE
ncbi:MAG: ADP-ribosylation factor-like protein [Candidatus Hodarchaeota archaeon]